MAGGQRSLCSKTPAILREGVYWLAARTGLALATAHNQALEPYGLNLRSFAVLATIGEAVARTQLEIAQIVGLDKTTLVVTIDDLEGRGLAERKADPHDRRARIVQVTPKGATLLKKAAASVRATERHILQGIDADDLAHLKSVLIGLLDGPLGECLRKTGSCL